MGASLRTCLQEIGNENDFFRIKPRNQCGVGIFTALNPKFSFLTLFLLLFSRPGAGDQALPTCQIGVREATQTLGSLVQERLQTSGDLQGFSRIEFQLRTFPKPKLRVRESSSTTLRGR